MVDRSKIKISVAKLIEIAYSSDEGLTKKIVLGSDNFKVTVNENGRATLSGSAGTLTFQGETALNGLGAKVRSASVMFTNEKNGRTRYTATYGFKDIASISISGSFSIEELILSCSGFLCRAARILKEGSTARRMEVNRTMGY